MKSRSAKNKGRVLQNLVAEKLSKLFNIPWGRDEDIKPRTMGESGKDILLYGKAKKIFKYSIECKNCEKWKVIEWIKQAKDNQDKGTDWMLICKKNHMNPVVILDLDAFLKLYKKILKK